MLQAARNDGLIYQEPVISLETRNQFREGEWQGIQTEAIIQRLHLNVGIYFL